MPSGDRGGDIPSGFCCSWPGAGCWGGWRVPVSQAGDLWCAPERSHAGGSPSCWHHVTAHSDRFILSPPGEGRAGERGRGREFNTPQGTNPPFRCSLTEKSPRSPLPGPFPSLSRDSLLCRAASPRGFIVPALPNMDFLPSEAPCCLWPHGVTSLDLGAQKQRALPGGGVWAVVPAGSGNIQLHLGNFS